MHKPDLVLKMRPIKFSGIHTGLSIPVKPNINIKKKKRKDFAAHFLDWLEYFEKS